MKRLRKLSQGCKSTIRRLVDQMHIADTDEQVRKNIQARAEKHPEVFTHGYAKAAGEYAVKHHHANQNLCKKFRI